MMKREIKKFSDGEILEFDQGKFDNWCIYLVKKNQRIAPKDKEYFKRLKQLSQTHGSDKIYHDFVQIFTATNEKLNPAILSQITELANKYSVDALEMDKLFTILYAGMVAEENKKNAILKKRIKRLGLHQVLMEGMNPDTAATFSKGKRWQQLDDECKQRSF